MSDSILNLDVDALDGTDGFRIIGEYAGDSSGSVVAGAGDVNGDGFDDVIILAPGAGKSFVVFGRADGSFGEVDLFQLDGTNGFEISGAMSGGSMGSTVSSAGDINGDGFDDILIGAEGGGVNGPGSGTTYVIFGKAAPFSATFDLAKERLINGFGCAEMAA